MHDLQLQYVELAELEKAQKIREKYNVEILVVFPYAQDVVKTWVEALPGQLESIKERKYPADPAKLDEAGKGPDGAVPADLPQGLRAREGDVLVPFPILVDGERTLSKKLDLFRNEWGGSKVDQNIPGVYIIDAPGCSSSNTWARTRSTARATIIS